MPRQRIRERTPPLAFVGRVLTFVLALLLLWYGFMTLLLAIKVAPGTVDSISGYQAAYDWAGGLTPDDVDADTTRAVMAGAGIVAFFLFGYLAYKQLPRPYLARRGLELKADDQGEVTVEPRADRAARRGRRHDSCRGDRGARPLRAATTCPSRSPSAAPATSPPPCRTSSSAWWTPSAGTTCPPCPST